MSTRPPLRIRTRSLAFAACLALFAGATSVGGAGRVELDLSGTWQYQKVSQLSFPPSNNWQTVSVPGFLSGWRYEHAWFRCQFSLPSSMAGTQVKLRFGGAKFNSQVWLNRTFIGGYLNGYEPFDFDISAAAKIGQTNELIVGVTDWTATFSTNVDFSSLPANENPRNFVKNVVLAPIGGRYDFYGLWQPVKVVSQPAVAVEDVCSRASILRGRSPTSLTWIPAARPMSWACIIRMNSRISNPGPMPRGG